MIPVKKKLIAALLCLTLLAVLSGCNKPLTDQQYADLINSTKYKRQIEFLPDLFDYEKAKEIYLSSVHQYRNLKDMYDNILSAYLVALMETDEDELLRTNVIDVLREYIYVGTAVDFLLFVLENYPKKMEIILPEIEAVYASEKNLYKKNVWNTYLWFIYYQNDDQENFDRIDKECEDIYRRIERKISYCRSIF